MKRETRERQAAYEGAKPKPGETARALFNSVARATLGLWIGRVQDWTDEHDATFSATRAQKMWRMRVEHAGRVVEAEHKNAAVALASLGRQLFG